MSTPDQTIAVIGESLVDIFPDYCDLLFHLMYKRQVEKMSTVLE